MSLPTVFIMLSVCFNMFSSSLSSHPNSAKKSGCFKVNSCKCIMKDGSGVINLKAMGDAKGFLGQLTPVSAESMAVSAEILLSFSPCQPFSQQEDLTGADCTYVAACLIFRYHRLNQYISRYISYGRHEGNEFNYNDTLKMLSVSYFVHDQQPLTVVHYHCNPNLSTSFIRDQSLSTEGPLQIWVESPCACPNACTMGDLGLGTIFLIILSLSAAAYFILGSCALRPFRSSSGIQISPEHSVWCMICYLCTESRPARGHYTDMTH
ncbi:uncharacterized protein LOC117252258 isoform X1 [Epinephelus lanceolatus]|uniref:uncharacterized protein LOC117252258 isoform X1 n=2 Tax=Epinephelus lanceolatus TaxID=310571 RepID=UPI001445AA63|nr:uncharacterized protein LOC117252258 isoform X1 [Epinephelus lanceolatus]